MEDLESWEESILKKANPNYKDPDLFFEREQPVVKKDEKGKPAPKGKK